MSHAYIPRQCLPHEGLEDDWGDDAIALQTTQNVDIGPGNIIETDTYGRYGVCDFDADGVDDLFLATRAGFWFSSFGEFPGSISARRRTSSATSASAISTTTCAATCWRRIAAPG